MTSWRTESLNNSWRGDGSGERGGKEAEMVESGREGMIIDAERGEERGEVRGEERERSRTSAGAGA